MVFGYSYSFDLPKIFDVNDEDSYTIKLDQKYASIEQGKLNIDSKDLEDGKYSIKITITDSRGESSKYFFEF